MMTRLEEELCSIVAHCSGTKREVLDRLYVAGLIDRRKAEAVAIRHTIDTLRHKGTRVTDAVTWAAEHFCCSYEKARSIYYSKP